MSIEFIPAPPLKPLRDMRLTDVADDDALAIVMTTEDGEVATYTVRFADFKRLMDGMSRDLGAFLDNCKRLPAR